ncbi:3'-5' exonuclease [Oceanithermus sp.]
MLLGRTIALDHDLLSRLRKTFDPKDLKEVESQLFELMADPAKAESKLEYKKHGGFFVFDLSKARRAILVEAGTSLVVVYVGNHDDAYDWIESRKVGIHPETQEIQVIRVIKSEKEVVIEKPIEAPLRPFSAEYLHSLGVPEEYIEPMRNATEEGLLDLLEGLPHPVQERILAILEGKPVAPPPKVRVADPLRHPNNRYRYLLIETKEELERALFGDWEDWMVFLHPAQRLSVEQNYKGPAKVTGAAGTGKTVVAIHRAVRLARENPDSRVLLTTFNKTLARLIEAGARKLAPELENLTVSHLDRLAFGWYQELYGKKPRMVSDNDAKAAIEQAISEQRLPEWASPSFVISEWRRVVDAWGIKELDEYLKVDRSGRGTPLNASRRKEIWPIFARVHELLASKNLLTWGRLARSLLDRASDLKRFGHVVVDEVQDLRPVQLQLLREIVPEGENDLFLAGDAAQRIYQTRVPWRHLGIETVGRSQRLWINYRTTRQIAEYASQILPAEVQEAEGESVSPRAISLLDGERPQVQVFSSPGEEIKALAAWLKHLTEEGFSPEQIAVVARTNKLLQKRAKAAIKQAGLAVTDMKDGTEGPGVRLATMHRVKGMEFRAVAVIGVEEGVVPNTYALDQQETEADRNAALALERQLLFVALSRPREKLWVSAAGRKSQLLGD